MDGVLYASDVRATLLIWEEDVRYKRNIAKNYREHDAHKADCLEKEAKAIEDCIADIEAMFS